MHNKYIQSIIDYNLRARYWKLGPGNECGPGNELGAQRAEQFPHLGNYTLTPGHHASVTKQYNLALIRNGDALRQGK